MRELEKLYSKRKQGERFGALLVLSAAKRPAPNGPASLHVRFRTHCQIPLDKKLSAAFSSSSRKRA